MAADPTKDMYEDLIRQYDLTAERRRTLTGQASNLLGFAGVIETILIAAVVALGTDPDARKLIIESIYHYPIIILAGIGFIAYIVSAIFSMLAFHEKEWIPAPEFPKTPGRLKDSVKVYWNNPSEYQRLDAARNLADGIEFDQEVNDEKYDNLRMASGILVIGIIASVIAGIFFLLSAI